MLVFNSAEVSAQILYADNFVYEPLPNKSPLPAPWQSVWPNQWIEEGWLHNQDQNGWPRDSEAVLHDSDTNWQNYELRATIDIPDNSPWTIATLLLRTQGYSRSSAGSIGKAYELNFLEHSLSQNAVNEIQLTRVDCSSGVCSADYLATLPLSIGTKGPFDVVANLIDGKISVSVDGSLVLSVTDPNPITYGGIGVHNVWESHARYDNFSVSSIPLPAAIWFMGTSFVSLLAYSRIKLNATNTAIH